VTEPSQPTSGENCMAREKERFMKENQELPEIPIGSRQLRAEERINEGDFQWHVARKEWVELIEVIGNMTDPAPREGFYCRRFAES